MVIKNASLSGFSRNYRRPTYIFFGYSIFFYQLSSDLSLPLHIDYHRFLMYIHIEKNIFFTCYTAKKRKAHLAQDNAWHITINKSAVARSAIMRLCFLHIAPMQPAKFLDTLVARGRRKKRALEIMHPTKWKSTPTKESFAFLYTLKKYVYADPQISIRLNKK